MAASWAEYLKAQLAIRAHDLAALRSLSLRAAAQVDEPSLYVLHREAMFSYVDSTWGWDEAWQRLHFANSFSPRDNVVLHPLEPGALPAGRISVTSHWRKVFLRDIELAPALRNHGIGSAVLECVLAFARREQKLVELHVLRCNPAQRLYRRHGFSIVHADDGRLTMRALP